MRGAIRRYGDGLVGAQIVRQAGEGRCCTMRVSYSMAEVLWRNRKVAVKYNSFSIIDTSSARKCGYRGSYVQQKRAQTVCDVALQ